MTQMHRQDFIDTLNARSLQGNVVDDQQWDDWLLAQPSGRDWPVGDWSSVDALPTSATLHSARGPLRHCWQLFHCRVDSAPPRDERGLRWGAGGFSTALHIGFALLLVWVAIVRNHLPPAQPDEERVALRYAGYGAGNSVPSPAPIGEQKELKASVFGSLKKMAHEAVAPTVDPVMAARALDAPVMPAAEQDVPPIALAVPDVSAIQPSADVSIDLPQIPLNEREVVVASPVPTTSLAVIKPVDVPRLVDRARDVLERQVILDDAVPTVSPPRIHRVDASPAVVQGREVQVFEREVVVNSAPRVQMPLAIDPVVLRPLSRAEPWHHTSPVTEREVAMVEVLSVTPAASVVRHPVDVVLPRADGASAPVREREVAIEVAAAVDRRIADEGDPGAGSPSGSRGSGLSTGAPATQDWSQQGRGADQWSGKRTAGDDGLWAADGRPKLPDQLAEGSRATTGAKDKWTRESLTTQGTWLKRPPYDHQPTAFEKYWAPNESLLAEWVRRGIESIDIPVPGTRTALRCVVSVLQFGGGCSLATAGMNAQPAQARAAPDIPFKRELQENNGSL